MGQKKEKTFQLQDYQNASEVRYCRLNELRDLKHSDEYVKDTIVTDYLNKVIDWGVAGFRVDASKHMFPEDVGM